VLADKAINEFVMERREFAGTEKQAPDPAAVQLFSLSPAVTQSVHYQLFCCLSSAKSLICKKIIYLIQEKCVKLIFLK